MLKGLLEITTFEITAMSMGGVFRAAAFFIFFFIKALAQL